jgi:hypothetical protein
MMDGEVFDMRFFGHAAQSILEAENPSRKTAFVFSEFHEARPGVGRWRGFVA